MKIVQKMSPQTIQSLSLLRMDDGELSSFLADFSEENPALELTDAFWEQGVAAGWNVTHHVSYDRESFSPLVEQMASSTESTTLYDHIRQQIEQRRLPSPMKDTILFIISGLNRSGLREETPEQIAEAMGIDVSDVDAALAEIQTMDPPGIAATSVQESLLWQLSRTGPDRIAEVILRDYWEWLAAKKYSQIAKKLKVIGEDVVLQAEKKILSLEPIPARDFIPEQRTQYITPDLIVQEDEAGLSVHLVNDYLPKLSVSSYYKGLAMTTEDANVKQYLQDCIEKAGNLVHGLTMRKISLLNCGKAILYFQEAFFRKEAPYPAPLKLADIAEYANVHESTVSRAVQGKYLFWNGNVYPLSFFLPHGLQSAAAELSADMIKDSLRRLIDAEDKSNPLSDKKLAELLSRDGVHISRRVIAKYRDEMGIFNTYVRRK